MFGDQVLEASGELVPQSVGNSPAVRDRRDEDGGRLLKLQHLLGQLLKAFHQLVDGLDSGLVTQVVGADADENDPRSRSRFRDFLQGLFDEVVAHDVDRGDLGLLTEAMEIRILGDKIFESLWLMVTRHFLLLLHSRGSHVLVQL